MGLIPQEIIAQVLERSDIGEVISSYIPLKRAGRNFKALCPFHDEKTPSFVVNPDKQIFHCFGCGAGGNAISFVMSQEHLDFPEAIRVLAQKAGVVIPEADSSSLKTMHLKEDIYKANEWAVKFFQQTLLSEKDPWAKEAREYLKTRGFSLAAVQKFHIGFAPNDWQGLISFLRNKDVSLGIMEKAGLIVAKESRDGFYDRFRKRIMFPIYDARGHGLGFGARSLLDEGSAKYINSPETPVYRKGNHLYGLHLSKDAIIRHDAAIVVEGYLDFITPFQAGVENLIASLGTALTVEQIRLMHRYTQNVIMLFDADEAGESATIRSLDVLIEEGMNVKVATLPSGEDPDSFVRKFGIRAFQEKLDQTHSLFDFKLRLLKARYPDKTIEERAKISAEMLHTINKFDNAVMRYGYLKQLANELSLPEEALTIELKKITLKTPASSLRPLGKTSVVKDGFKKAEGHILRLLLEEKDFIPVTKAQVSLEYFQDQQIRVIISKIFELFEQGQEVNIQYLMNCFEDTAVLQRLSSLMAMDEVAITDKTKVHQDCLKRLEEDYFKLERRNLRFQIELAESSKDYSHVDTLKEKFNQLLKRSS